MVRFETTPCWSIEPVGVPVDCGYLVVPENRHAAVTTEVRVAVAILRGDVTGPGDHSPVVFKNVKAK